jgi:hypothetical protein
VAPRIVAAPPPNQPSAPLMEHYNTEQNSSENQDKGAAEPKLPDVQSAPDVPPHEFGTQCGARKRSPSVHSGDALNSVREEQEHNAYPEQKKKHQGNS